MQQPKTRLVRDSETGEPFMGFGKGTVETFLKAYYPIAENTIRVASGFFTLKGYKLGRSYLADSQKVQFRILVGSGEGGNTQLAIREEISRELKNGEGPYAEIVRDIIRRIERKEFIIYNAREVKYLYHCKFYVCDEKILVHGSGNYTGYGLIDQHEQAEANRNYSSIKNSIDWFEEASESAEDMTEPLLKILREWLKLVSPFDVYLKFLACLNIFFDRENRPGLLLPVFYQKGVIASAIEQIKEYRASIVIAATGLGKTIIGAELAFLLMCQKIISRVILVAPLAVHEEWKKHLKDRALPVDLVSIDLLFSKSSPHSRHKVNQLDGFLQEATSQTLVIIDEVHTYRNQLLEHWKKHIKKRKGARGSVVANRLRPVVNEQGANLLLLTATPFGTNPSNMESLQMFLPDIELSGEDYLTSWRHKKINTLAQFTALPVVTSIGLRQVLGMARERGDVFDGRVFVQFAAQRKYMPETVHLRKVTYKLPLVEELSNAFETGFFSQIKPSMTDGYIDKNGDFGTQPVNYTEGQFIAAWLGSSATLIRCLNKNLYSLSRRDKQKQIEQIELFSDEVPAVSRSQRQMPTEQERKTHGYKAAMKIDWKLRNQKLSPILEKLEHLSEEDKMLKLLELLETHVLNQEEKVIVFTEHHSTAVILAESLRRLEWLRGKVGCTVSRQGKNGYALDSLGKRNEILDNFSPNSRKAKALELLSVLVCTDANGVGVNLQDANVVVNYDPADSADVLFQRAGRILRFTENAHRKIYLYTFKPELDSSFSPKSCKRIADVFDKMVKRHGYSKRTFGLSILPEEDQDTIHLNDIGDETRFMGSFDVGGGKSSETDLYRHAAVFDQYRNKELVKNGSYGSKLYKGKQHKIVTLFRHNGLKCIVLYNLVSKKIEYEGIAELLTSIDVLNIIACHPATQNAPVEFEAVEKAAHLSIRKWREMVRFIGTVNLLNLARLCMNQKNVGSTTRPSRRRCSEWSTAASLSATQPRPWGFLKT